MSEEGTKSDPPVPRVIHRVMSDGRKLSYEITGKIGSGGFATVYSAISSSDGTKVAVKAVSKSRFVNQKVKQRVVGEVELHRSLRHANIVNFVSAFQDPSFVYLVIGLCDGGNVLELVQREKRLSEARSGKIARQVLEALSYLHGRGVIHRDLKLQNLLIGEGGNVKVADFGLSARGATASGVRPSTCGTPSYMAPEVVTKSEMHTSAIDIWCLGVCVYVMLTGRQPFKAQSHRETYEHIKTGQYAWPADVQISETARSFVEAALRHDPADRATAEVLLSHSFVRPPQGRILGGLNVGAAAVVVGPRRRVTLRGAEMMADAVEEAVVLPDWSVRIWWDYTSRYGFAYLLRNGVCGACFNDATRLILSGDEGFVQYWSSPRAEKPTVEYMSELETSPLRKKMLLVQHFAREMKARVEMGMIPCRTAPEMPLGHVKYWAKTKDGIMFRMASRDVQANFRDHTKLVIDAEAKGVLFDNGQTVSAYKMADLAAREKHRELRCRFATVKEMAKELI